MSDEEHGLGHDQPVGEQLAGQVADILMAGHQIAYEHRDYCGMGLRYERSTDAFLYGEVLDGHLWDHPSAPAVRFVGREAFVRWLAAQTDASFEGEGRDRHNQRLTRERLRDAVRR